MHPTTAEFLTRTRIEDLERAAAQARRTTKIRPASLLSEGARRLISEAIARATERSRPTAVHPPSRLPPRI